MLSGKNKTASRSHSSGRNHDHSRCPLELSFATCASLDDEQMLVRCSSRIRQPFVRLRDPDCPKAHRRRSGRGEADNIPRRQTPVPVDVPPHELQPNQIASTPVTMWRKGNDADPSANKPTTASSLAAAEVDDALLARGGNNELLDGRQGPSRNCVDHRTSPQGANLDITTSHPAK